MLPLPGSVPQFAALVEVDGALEGMGLDAHQRPGAEASDGRRVDRVEEQPHIERIVI